MSHESTDSTLSGGSSHGTGKESSSVSSGSASSSYSYSSSSYYPPRSSSSSGASYASSNGSTPSAGSVPVPSGSASSDIGELGMLLAHPTIRGDQGPGVMATFTPAGETEPIDVWLPEIYRGLYAYEDVVFSLNDETGAWGGMIGGDTLTPPPVPPSPDGPPYGVWVDPVLGPVTVS